MDHGEPLIVSDQNRNHGRTFLLTGTTARGPDEGRFLEDISCGLEECHLAGNSQDIRIFWSFGLCKSCALQVLFRWLVAAHQVLESTHVSFPFSLAWIKPLHSDSLLYFLQLFECWFISTFAFTVLVALSVI